MAKHPDSMEDFNIEDYTSQVDFDGEDVPEDQAPDSAGDTGRYTPVGHRGNDLDAPDEEEDMGEPKGKKRKKKQPLGIRILKKLLFILIWLICIVIAGYFLAKAGWGWANDLLALNKEASSATIELDEDYFSIEETVDDEGKPKTVYHADMDVVSDELYDNGLIEYKWLFKLFAKFTHKDSSLVPGTYELNTDMDYSALLRNMSPRSTARATVNIMIPEGYTLKEIITLLDQQGVATAADLEDAAANYDFDYDFLDKSTLGDPNRLEGYLFPDTYQFYVNTDGATALARMLNNFDSKFTDEMRTRAEELGYTLPQIITVASIVEKETDGLDQLNIASVIYNRLTKTDRGTNGYLQMDSTIQYILDERKSSLTAEDLAIDSPYNTYLYAGLPAGPICNPGAAAINAALNPAETDYFYFVLGDDGATHFFERYDDFLTFRDAQTGEPVVTDDTDNGENYEG